MGESRSRDKLDFCSGSWNHRGQSAAFPTGSADGTLQGGFAGMRISFQEVPLDVRRSAAQRLESIRGTDVGRSADAAQFSRDVCPIYRPDLDEIAYYEFELITGSARVQLVTPGAISSRVFERKGKERAAAEPVRPVRGTGHGFIVASAGPHDFPLPHWSLESPPPAASSSGLQRATGRRSRASSSSMRSLTSRRTRMASAWRPSATCRNSSRDFLTISVSGDPEFRLSSHARQVMCRTTHPKASIA